MSTKEFRKLNKAELLEVIHQLQQRIKILTKENTRLEEKAQERYEKLEQSGNIALATLSIHEVFSTAQKAADDYVATVSARADATEQRALELMAQVQAIGHELRGFLGEMDGEEMGLDSFRLQIDEVLEQVSGYLPASPQGDADTGESL